MKYYNYPNGTKTAEALDSENTAVVKGPDGKYIAPNELPAITAQDAGKVVKVNAAGTGLEYGEAGGGNVLHVVFGWDEDDNVFCDHSFSEVFNALENKDLVIFSEQIINGAGRGVYAISCDYRDDYIAVVFNLISVDFNIISVDSTICTINMYEYTIRPDNTTKYTYKALEVQGTPVE